MGLVRTSMALKLYPCAVLAASSSPAFTARIAEAAATLGGHLKSGHGWTGQNRPPGERPRLVISIPRLPRDANRAGPWCASFGGRT